MDDETVTNQKSHVEDWESCTQLLPAQPQSFIEERLQTFFAPDFMGVQGQDYYVYMYPNGVCVTGLSPTHSLIRSHRGANQQATDSVNPASSSAQEVNDSRPPATEAVDTEGLAAAASTKPDDGATPGDPASSGKAEFAKVEYIPLDRLKKVNFDPGRNPNKRDGLKQSGKNRNKGAQLCRETVLCRLESDKEWPTREGYLAVFYPSDPQFEELQRALVPATEFFELRGMAPEDMH
eukprot:gene14684-20721_t